MKALITGGLGFVGRYLYESLLKKNNEVFIIEKSNVNLESNCYCADILNKLEVKKILSDIKPDYIYHLAGQSSVAKSWECPQKTIEINTIGTINILDCIRELGLNCKILIIGSSEEYGFKESSNVYINESTYTNPQNPYAVSKLAQTNLSLIYSKAYNLNIVIARPFNHIGPRQNDSFVVSNFAKQIADIEYNNKKPIIYVGNLSAKRDFTDVRDIVEAYISLIEYGKYGNIYNIGSGKSFSIQYILDTLISYSNKKIVVEIDSTRFRAIDVDDIICDINKIKTEIGWSPNISIEKSLLSVLDYWRDYFKFNVSNSEITKDLA